ncbi:mannitol dehydrogenase family protein [Ornithinimicrobium pekingense]|uniref:Mannitol-1-phosphate 5-dehydrogenase n=1 Tax=Ornithinimicrobium pekingense TaxID=384677 RepID=A0ABQ2F5M8_9MICO|nr:mannitol dehydrogenase family protein [Ornithinimicrobium pekingense]GGK62101.1 mannitol-1-phosphate 5-dehydrogenase [Ornithinimicrobium pekingense]
MSSPLRRTTPAPPVRMVHLGLGNFFRAHQAWYTHRANQAGGPGDRWGIAAFTGSSTEIAEQLSAQDGLYTLVVDGAEGARAEVVESLVAAHAGSDLQAWHRYLADPVVTVLTTTVTEAGYRRGGDGGLDLEDEQVRADLEDWPAGRRDTLRTAPVRIASGLAARRDVGAGGLTIVPCDNLPDNGAVARSVVLGAAEQLDPTLAAWVEEHVSFVTTAVDRITPRPTDADRAAVPELTGVDDPTVVVTEPFVEWDLAGDFVGGRPAWETAGAVITDDVRPYETRKLWLLNGAHSLLAYAGSIRGHETVAEAMGDELLAGWVRQWWDVAVPHLELPETELRGYTSALVERFENPRIRHLLAQIAADGMQKIPVRIVPALRAEHEAGGDVDGALRAVVAWVLHARGAGAPLTDAAADRARALVDGDLASAVGRVLQHWEIDPGLLDRALHLAAELGGEAHPDEG